MPGGNRLRIAASTGPVIPIPPPKDGAFSIFMLTQKILEGLSDRGNDVFAYAPHGSQLAGVQLLTRGVKPVATNAQEWAEVYKAFNATVGQMLLCSYHYLSHDMIQKARRGEYDLMYFAHPLPALIAAIEAPTVPVVVTLHNPLWYYRKAPFGSVFKLYSESCKNLHFISVSNAQRDEYPDLTYQSTIRNGVDTDFFIYNEAPKDYLLHVGRVVPEKGLEDAIYVAQKTHKPLLIAGPVYDQIFFERKVKPHLGAKIKYLGPKTPEELVTLYQDAQALIHPSEYETAGMTLVEAGSCGTPVIAYRRGGIVEVVRNNETGFLVETPEQMISAVCHVTEISRHNCRRNVEENFSLNRMVDDYHTIFHELSADSKKRTIEQRRHRHRQANHKNPSGLHRKRTVIVRPRPPRGPA